MSRETVIVTGGAKRVGAAIARHFAAHGFDIALHYNRSEAEAKSLQQEIKSGGTDCQLFQHDLTDIAGLDALMARIKAAMPGVSVLVNNASVFEHATLAQTDEALFDRQLDTNFKAAFFLTQSFARHVGKGAVVNILDTDVTQTHVGQLAYLLSKKALAEFTVMGARALGPDIRINGVGPGYVLPHSDEDAQAIAKVAPSLPLRAHPSYTDVAQAAWWLCTQHGITGQIIYVDGGKHVL